ncbi:MAG: putative Ig domain-containing protein, partial [Verrucomicrobiales bacterium]|nr:putative Ig domain-containing protein [Verrucomicrobiales bacterium]
LSGGFSQISPGLYRATGIPVQTANLALRALSFVPQTNGRVTPTTSEPTVFTITVNDAVAPPVTDNITTVTAIHALVDQIQTLFSGSNSQEFGQPVAVGGDVFVVGAPFEKHGTAHPSGSAFIFSRHQGGPDNWGLVKEISAPDGVAGDQFGFSAGVSGDTIVVGAPKDNDAGKSSGSAYIFQRDVGGPENWGFVKKLQPASTQSGDDFGFAVTMSGDTIAVGAHLHDTPNSNGGAIYVFYRNQGGADNWGEVKKVTPPDVANNDEFGYSVSLSGDYLIGGTPFDDDRGSNSGSASVFERNETTANNWGRKAKLVPTDLAGGNQFGWSVSISGNLAAVGTPLHAIGGSSRGAAYVFDRGTGAWAQLKKITQTDGASGDQFGTSVSISGEHLVVGARLDDDVASNAGSAYVFGRNYNAANPATPAPESWAQVEKFVPLTAVSGGHFGFSVSISGHTVAVGLDFDGGSPGDTTYLYRLKFNNAPLIADPILDQIVVVGSAFNFMLPASTFTDADLAELLTLNATLADGSPLPGWLSFNPVTGTFSGTPTAGDVGSVSIKVTATDLDIASVSDLFETDVNPIALLRIRVAREDPRVQKSFEAEYDGRTNFHRYAFGADPADGEAGAGAPVVGIVRYNETGHLFLKYNRRVNDPRVQYLIEGTTDLVTWKSAQSRFEEVLSSAVDDEFETVINVFAGDEKGASPMQFFRIRAAFGHQQ